jgi:hypothetical protein
LSNRCAEIRKVKGIANKAFPVASRSEQMTKIMYFLLTRRFLPKRPSISSSVRHYFRAQSKAFFRHCMAHPLLFIR